MYTVIPRILILLFVAAPTLRAQEAWQQRNVDGTAPSGRFYHTAVWTGSEMIVWGGGPRNLDTGGRYNPARNSWTPLSTTGTPAGRGQHTAVWTGSEMIVWGGTLDGVSALNTGGRYNPAENTWTAVTGIGAPTGRYDHTAIWTGSEMIVWGGETGTGVLSNGGRYNPATDSWTAVSTTSGLAARSTHTAIWTGSEMVVWGGGTGRGTNFGTGGRYNPATDSWTAVSTSGAPTARSGPRAVWTGSEMIVWGGYGGGYRTTGGRYNPTGNIWTGMTTIGAPAGRERDTAVWTGSEMIIWGGQTGGFASYLNTGARYYSAGDRWTPVISTGAPEARALHTAVWTGGEMIVWGGTGCCPIGTFSYTPDCEDFQITSAVFDSGNLTLSFPTVTGRTYTLWRSDALAAGTWTNTGLTPLAGTGATLTFTVSAPAAGVPERFFRVQVTTDP